MNALRCLMAGFSLLLLVVTVPVAARAKVPNAHPARIGLWHLDGDGVDSSGNDNAATAYHGLTFSTDRKVGTAAPLFAGPNNYLSVPDNPTSNHHKSVDHRDVDQVHHQLPLQGDWHSNPRQ